jgi:hypothetical protein
MFIYMHEQTLDRLTNIKSKRQLGIINLDETKLGAMEDRLLPEEISVAVTTSFIIIKGDVRTAGLSRRESRRESRRIPTRRREPDFVPTCVKGSGDDVQCTE